LSNAPILIKSPKGSFLPPSPDLPGALPRNDPFSALSPFMDSPRLRIGRRGSALDLTVDLMIEMQHDELISHLKGYQAALLVKADYEIKCRNPQKRRFFQAMYDAIHQSLMLSCSPALFFGFQPLVKEFERGLPPSDDPNPIWQGSAEPIILTGVKQIHPELAKPVWADDGSFNGIQIKGVTQRIPHIFSLWLTIGKHHVFGDFFGWGRARSAYFPWWDKNFAGDQQTLFVHRGADPIPLVEHPPGRDSTGKLHSETAAEIGEGARAGATITLPSDPYPTRQGVGIDAEYSGHRQWSVSYLSNEGDIAPFLQILDRADRRIAMAMLIPPQAVLEAKSLGLGGPNTAEILGTVAEETLMQDASEIDEHLNKYVFPFLSNANFGPDDDPVMKVTKGLSGRSRASLQEAWNALVGRQDTDVSMIDFAHLTESLSYPIKSPETLAAEAATEAPAVAPIGTVAPEATAAPSGVQPATAAPAPTGPLPILPATPVAQSLHFSSDANESRVEDEELVFESDDDLTEEDTADILATARKLVQDEESAAFSLSRLFAFVKKKGESYERALRRIQTGTQEEIDAQINAWKRGNAPADTVKRIASILRKAALTTAQLGKLERGDDGPLSLQEQQKARTWAIQQQSYLKGVYKKMRETLDEYPALSGAQKVIQDAKRREAVEKTAGTLKGWRLPLYVNGLRAVYEVSRARFPVEVFPRSGATECLANCHCRLEWEEDELGLLVHWVLGEVKENHCVTCPQLAANGPYREGQL